MTPMTVRGLPRGLQNDAWWMAADAQTGVGRGVVRNASRPVWLLVALIAVVDYLVLQDLHGFGFVVLVATLAGAAHWVVRAQVPVQRALIAWAILGVSLLPAIDLLQFTSFAIAWSGLTVFAAILVAENWKPILAKIPFAGLVQTVDDVMHPQIGSPQKADLTDWILPVGIGAVFAALFILANPLVAYFAEGINPSQFPSVERVIAWVLAAIVIWPLLRLSALKLTPKIRKRQVSVKRVTLINRRSVARALIVFNVIFAVQTVLDLGYLWGGARLPEGMTYATYAHRGAYPLMVTALLAGAFALLAQPWLDGKPMRWLLMIWVGQTMLLVLSSILRLDLYVDSYSLTHLRVAAFIWMVVVALGLVVLMLQIIWQKPAIWMLTGAGGIGVAALYLASVVNISGYVAQHQLTQGPLDRNYVCSLGEGATVAVQRYDKDLCGMMMNEPRLSQPSDWREWGFRNARLRNSLATLKTEVAL